MPYKPENYLLLNHELARPIGVVTGTRVGGSNKQPRSRTIATPCKVTYADGSTRIIEASNSRKSPTPAQVRARALVRAADKANVLDTARARNTQDHALAATMGSVHN